MDRSQKADLVAELKNVFTETSVAVITRNHGLTVAQSTDLRLKMRDAGAQYKVAKNSLALIALEDTRYKPIGDLLKVRPRLRRPETPSPAAKGSASISPRRTTSSKSSAEQWATRSLNVNGSRRWPSFPRSINCVRPSSGIIQAPATKIARTINEPGVQLAPRLRAYAARKLHKHLAFHQRTTIETAKVSQGSIKWLTSPAGRPAFRTHRSRGR